MPSKDSYNVSGSMATPVEPVFLDWAFGRPLELGHQVADQLGFCNQGKQQATYAQKRPISLEDKPRSYLHYGFLALSVCPLIGACSSMHGDSMPLTASGVLLGPTVRCHLEVS